MTKIHLQAVARLQRQVTELEKERVRLQGYQCDIVGKEVAKLTKGMMPIPKPLTNEEIIETCDTWVISDIGSNEVINIVRRTERAHGIGEKE